MAPRETSPLLFRNNLTVGVRFFVVYDRKKIMLDRLNWVEINLKNFAHNTICVKRLIGPKVKLMAVIKANAYGHGVVGIAKYLEKRLPIDYLGVVCLYEARILRESGITLPILILNYIDEEGVCRAMDLDIAVTVTDEKTLRVLDNYARKKAKMGKIHVKIDTGMHRAGLLPSEALKFIPKIEQYKNIYLEGVFTHFAASDEKDLAFTNFQNQVFKETLRKLHARGVSAPMVHAANSGAVLRLPESYYNLVRPGIIIYGLSPTGTTSAAEFIYPFVPKPILSWKTKIIQIRTIEKGESVGYGRKFTAQKQTRVGLLPVGYADGFRRSPNWEFVLVKGKKSSILGRVSMDQTSINITDIHNANVGDEVVLIGEQGKERITAAEVAERLGTICHEVTCAIAPRVPRLFL